MNNKNIASLPQYHPINKSPNFEIRNIIPQDTSNFLQLQKHLDKETDFMLLYPEERNSSIFLLQDNIQSSLKYGSLLLVIDDGNKLVGYLQASRGRYKKNTSFSLYCSWNFSRRRRKRLRKAFV